MMQLDEFVKRFEEEAGSGLSDVEVVYVKSLYERVQSRLVNQSRLISTDVQILLEDLSKNFVPAPATPESKTHPFKCKPDNKKTNSYDRTIRHSLKRLSLPVPKGFKEEAQGTSTAQGSKAPPIQAATAAGGGSSKRRGGNPAHPSRLHKRPRGHAPVETAEKIRTADEGQQDKEERDARAQARRAHQPQSSPAAAAAANPTAVITPPNPRPLSAAAASRWLYRTKAPRAPSTTVLRAPAATPASESAAGNVPEVLPEARLPELKELDARMEEEIKLQAATEAEMQALNDDVEWLKQQLAEKAETMKAQSERLEQLKRLRQAAAEREVQAAAEAAKVQALNDEVEALKEQLVAEKMETMKAKSEQLEQLKRLRQAAAEKEVQAAADAAKVLALEDKVERLEQQLAKKSKEVKSVVLRAAEAESLAARLDAVAEQNAHRLARYSPEHIRLAILNVLERQGPFKFENLMAQLHDDHAAAAAAEAAANENENTVRTVLLAMQGDGNLMVENDEYFGSF